MSLGPGQGVRRSVPLRVLGFAAVAVFIASAFTPVPNLLGHWLAVAPEIAPADAVVVLGSTVRADATLDDMSFRRAVHGVVLHRQDLAPLLVLSGQTRGGGLSEAVSRARLATALGVPPEALVTLDGVRTTREEARRIAQVLRERHLRRVLLVTNGLHMARARRLFAREGLEVLAAPSDDVSIGVTSPGARMKLMRQVAEELLARAYYWMAGYL